MISKVVIKFYTMIFNNIYQSKVSLKIFMVFCFRVKLYFISIW